jgi:flagellar FliL protein
MAFALPYGMDPDIPLPPRPSPLVVIGLVANTLVGAGALALALTGRSAAKEAEHAAAKREAAAPGAVGPQVKLEPFVVNLNDPEGSRYLKLTTELELSGPEAQAELNVRMAQVRDALLIHLSGQTYDGVRGEEGKKALRDGLHARIEGILGARTVKGLYFTEFVVQ